MNILLECSFFGGSGGLEKLTKDLLLQKPKDYFIDVLVSSGINSDKEFKEENVNFIETVEEYKKYNLFIKIGMNFNNIIIDNLNKNCIKVLNPAGYIFNEDIINKFDFLWQESPNSYNIKNIKIITVAPPVIVPHKEIKNNFIVNSLKDDFFVVVSNDYDVKVKGIDLLYKFAEISKNDIVWFCSDNKNGIINLKSADETPPRLKIARNINKDIIIDTIKKSKAYICFSRRESFSYSIAEAMLLKKPIITQNVGVVKYNPEHFLLYEENNLEKINSFVLPSFIDYSSIISKFENFWEKFILSLKNE